MLISDWRSDVFSSDLRQPDFGVDPGKVGGPRRLNDAACLQRRGSTAASEKTQQHDTRREWKSAESAHDGVPTRLDAISSTRWARRSEERRARKESIRQRRSQWSAYNKTQTTKT